MKKTFIALSAVALLCAPLLVSAESRERGNDRERSASSTRATSTPKIVTPATISCVQNAIEKRETTLIAGHNAFNTSVTGALTARKDGLKSAYALADREAAKAGKKTVWNAFGTSTKAAHDTMRTVRKTAWNTFNTDMRACGVAHEEAPRTVTNPTSSL
jgi:hypothetical protein